MAKQYSMRLFIIVTFILLIITTFCIIGYFVFSNWTNSTEKIVTQIQNNAHKTILRQMDNFMHLSVDINQSNYPLLQNEIIPISDKNKRALFFASVINSYHDEIYSFSYGTEQGEYYGARRSENHEIEIIENNAVTKGRSRYYAATPNLTAGALTKETEKFDPRDRDWYKIVKNENKPMFSPIYQHFIMNDLAISAAYPIYGKNGILQGVLGTHLTLSKINDYLTELVKDSPMLAYIIENNSGYIVANSLEQPNFKIRPDTQMQRLSIEDIDNDAIRIIYQAYKRTGQTHAIVNSNEDKFHVKLTNYRQPGLDWLIITAVPESIYTAGINKSIRLTVIISMIAIMIAIIIYMKSTKIIFKPIYDLIHTTEKFSEGNFSHRAKIFRNDEIGKLSGAYNKMAEQLYLLIHSLESKIKDRTAELEKTIFELKNSEDYIRLLLDSTAEAIYGIDNAGNCTFANASCLAMLKYKDQSDLIGKNMHDLIHHTHLNGCPFAKKNCRIFSVLTSGICTHVEDEVFWKSDGTYFPVEYFAYPQYRNNKLIGVVVTFLDITERKKSQAEILYLSYRDQLTGLYNRIYYEEALQHLNIPDNLPLCIVMADMNGLKLINDSFGHAIGDRLLKTAAEVLIKGCRADDIVARLGGDEFVILLPKTDCYEVEKIIKRIKSITSKQKTGTIDLSISFGYSIKISPDQNIEEVIKTAEDYMYRNKLLESPSMRKKAVRSIISTLHEKNRSEKIHSLRVSELCQLMGQTLSLTPAEIEELKMAGLLHDIGKIAIDENILSKPGKLTEAEWEEIKRHPEIGYRILNTVNTLSKMAEYVLSHHERWIGTGYPKGIKGSNIPLQSRIIHIADAYDAMTNDRSYRSALSKEQAIKELEKNAGTQFDPELVPIFIQSILSQKHLCNR